MSKYKVVTKLPDNDSPALDGIIVFPQNRTLYVDQFTDEAPDSDEEREVFSPKCMKDVFDYYRPQKDIDLNTEDGLSVHEYFCFKSIEDFEDKHLIAQSELLSTENDKIETIKAVIKQLKDNFTLHNVLKDDSSRDDLKNALKALHEEITQCQEAPSELLLRSINSGLAQFGGFKMIKGFVKGIDKMDPNRKAVRNIFLADETYEKDRLKLENELAVWISLLECGDVRPAVLVESCEYLQNKAEQTEADNLRKIHDESRQLEIVYRTLNAFFSNAGQSEVKCLTLMNVNKKNIGMCDSDDTLAVRKELQNYYNRLDLKNNYSLLVIPGYLGEAVTVRMWAITAYRNKVILVTDYKDCPDYESLADSLYTSNLKGQDEYLTHIIMTCNYLLGRKKSKLANEEDNLFIPASGALAGRMANTEEIVISQGAAGRKFGKLNNVKGVRINMSKTQIANLWDLSVIPMIEGEGCVFAFSNNSLYNGAHTFVQEYPVVRVLDWICKVIQHLFNARAFTLFTYTARIDLREQIMDFLDDYKGYNDPRKLIGSYSIKKLDKDPTTKDICLIVELNLNCSAYPFVLELIEHDSEVGPMWEDNIYLKTTAYNN